MKPQNQTAVRVPLERANPQIGDAMQIISGKTSQPVTLIGYLKGQSLIVTPPEHSESTRPAAGQPITVRFTGNHCPYEFSTTVRHVASEPFPHLYLECPEEVMALKERRHERIKINITGIADIPSGQTLSCVVRDISMGGALIAVDTPTGGVNDQLVLTLKVAINGIEYSLSLDSEIRSIRLGEAETSHGGEVLQGLAFRDLTEKDFLALAAFDLLPDWSPAS